MCCAVHCGCFRLTLCGSYIMAKNYESEITQFLKAYKQEKPDTEARQREGRAILWDKHIDPELHDGFRAARVYQCPYVYYQND